MEKNEKSLVPQMSAPVERKLLEAPAVGEGGTSVQPSSWWGSLVRNIPMIGGAICKLTGTC